MDVDVTPSSDDGHYYNEETASAQVATRFATYAEFSGAPFRQRKACLSTGTRRWR